VVRVVRVRCVCGGFVEDDASVECSIYLLISLLLVFSVLPLCLINRIAPL
jgi:hypothetical protein